MTALDRLRERMGSAELGWFMAITAILVLSVVWHPLDDGGFVICLMRRATGLPCPGCGLTRSFCALAKGEVARSAHFHPFGPVLFAVACAYWLRGIGLMAGWRHRVARFDAWMMRWRVPYALATVFVLVWAVRLGVLAWTGELARLARTGALAHLF